MPQKFNPDTVLLSETLGKEITSELITDLFTDSLVKTSKVVQLGQKEEMDGKMVRKGVEIGQLTDAYFVGEGQKIGTAKVQTKSYVLESRKLAVILPVTEEALNYTWTDYFDSIKDKIVDLFNKKIDGAAFLGLYGNPFGANVLASAKAASNVVSGDITLDNIYAVEDTPEKDLTLSLDTALSTAHFVLFVMMSMVVNIFLRSQQIQMLLVNLTDCLMLNCNCKMVKLTQQAH